MAFEPLELAEQHPGLVVGGIIVLGLGLYLLFSGGGGGGQVASSGGVDPTVAAAEIAAQSQANTVSAQLSAQQESDNTTLAAQNTAAQVANNANQFDYQATIAGISASLAGLENTNGTALSIANLVTNEQTHAIDVNASLLTNQQSSNQSVLLAAIKEHRDISLSPTGGAILTAGAGTASSGGGGSSSSSTTTNTGSQASSVINSVGGFFNLLSNL